MMEQRAGKSIKAVFFDVDGTLVSFNTHQIPASNLSAIQRLQQKGIRVIVATGRSINTIQNVSHIPFDGFITFNGGCCVATDGRLLSLTSIDPGNIQNLLEYSGLEPLSFSLMYKDKVTINDVTPEVVGMYAHVNLPVPPVIDRSNVDMDGVLQANIFIGPEGQDQFMQRVMPDCIATRWTPLFADVNPAGVSKQSGIDVFCQEFGIDVSQTMAFGDGGNDISMLRHAGIGVAMGSASAEVVASADYHTVDVDDDGILKALEHFGVL
ncbi:MAG: Cof-type HAD-IIB family hydrolase [Chitinophagaceae bacterium]|nr:MAG: Cof-type HAD-IIB family hydrolase [Chitinophagaceae bacterium]